MGASLPFTNWCCLHHSVLLCAVTLAWKKEREESSTREYPCLISLSPEGLPSLPVAQSLLPPPPLYLAGDTPSGKTEKPSPEGADHNTAYSLHQLGSF